MTLAELQAMPEETPAQAFSKQVLLLAFSAACFTQAGRAFAKPSLALNPEG